MMSNKLNSFFEIVYANIAFKVNLTPVLLNFIGKYFQMVAAKIFTVTNKPNRWVKISDVPKLRFG